MCLLDGRYRGGGGGRTTRENSFVGFESEFYRLDIGLSTIIEETWRKPLHQGKCPRIMSHHS